MIYCPKCNAKTRVIDSRRKIYRHADSDSIIVRRRKCQYHKCWYVFTTYESLQQSQYRELLEELEKKYAKLKHYICLAHAQCSTRERKDANEHDSKRKGTDTAVDKEA